MLGGRCQAVNREINLDEPLRPRMNLGSVHDSLPDTLGGDGRLSGRGAARALECLSFRCSRYGDALLDEQRSASRHARPARAQSPRESATAWVCHRSTPRAHVEDVLSVEEGSLYPALYRMERRGWLASTWAVTDTGRRARFYRLTRMGRAQLEAETASWLRLTTAVADVLNG